MTQPALEKGGSFLSMQPPKGVAVNIDGPNPWQYTAVTVTSTFVALALLFGSIRAYTKVYILRKSSWDDLTFALGLATTIGFWATFVFLIDKGFGRHLWNLPVRLTTSDIFIKPLWLAAWFGGVPVTLVKATFFILYWNIFRPVHWLKVAILVGGITVFTINIAFTLTIFIGATPKPGQTFLEALTCRPCKVTNVPSSIWSLVSDIYILVLPISGVVRLQLPPKKKAGVIMVFMAGIGACICSSLSIYYRKQLTEDTTYSAVPIQVLVIVEVCVGLCITCVPTTSKFFRHMFPPGKQLDSGVEPQWKRLLASLAFVRSRATADRDEDGKSNGITGPYRNIQGPKARCTAQDDGELAMYSERGVTTKVVAKPEGAVGEGVILCKVELEQH